VRITGSRPEIDAALCANCGDCLGACPFGALSENDGGGVRRSWELCQGCGVCEATCATGAISLARDEGKGTPLDVLTL